MQVMVVALKGLLDKKKKHTHTHESEGGPAGKKGFAFFQQ